MSGVALISVVPVFDSVSSSPAGHTHPPGEKLIMHGVSVNKTKFEGPEK